MKISCPICGESSERGIRVPFSTSFDGQESPSLALQGTDVLYVQCPSCGHAYAPDLLDMSPEWFAEFIYNTDYPKYDLDYLDAEHGRAANQASALIFAYHFARKQIRHLDYGSGDGQLTQRMNAAGFDSTAYDPFSQKVRPEVKFNLITAFEVAEHVTDPHAFLSAIESFMDDICLIRLGTMPNDDEDISSWWYTNPRVGHINLFSRKSLVTLATQHQFNLARPGGTDFYLWRNLPEWAKY